jgi:O-methyltransferase
MPRLETLAAAARLLLRPGKCRAYVSAALAEERAAGRYSAIRAKYAEFTMIPAATYANNLRLIDAHRDVKGCVVECGVWRGGMIAGAAELLGPDRHYALFDSFQGLPPVREIDGPAAKAWQADEEGASYHDNCAAPREFADRAMRLAGARDVGVHPGWFEDTLKNYVPPGAIAVLRLDGDWYDSTMVCLEALFPYVAPGGVVIVDDYSAWDGCSRAVHDYLSRHQSPARILRWRDDVTYLKVPAAAAQPVLQPAHVA